MNVVQENVNALNAKVTITLQPEDYQENFEKSLKNYRKQVALPGFRPGNVPMGLLKKKYGPSILAEEVNKILSDKIQAHIEENKLNILGHPLPMADDSQNIDWENPGELKFSYEMGLAPEFEVKLSKKDVFTYNKVKVDKELIDKQANDYARRFGKLISVEESQEDDMMLGQFTELNEDGTAKEGGVKHSSTISIQFVEDEESKKKLTGLKPGDVVTIDPKKVSKGETDMGAMLGITKEEAKFFNALTEFKVTDVKRIELHPFDQELYDKVYGEGNVTNEEEFRNKIKEEIERIFAKDIDAVFRREVIKTLVDKVKFELPDEFLKRWIQTSNEKPVTLEQIEAEYSQYQHGLKWQLIENKIIGDNNITVAPEEAIELTKGLMAQQYAQYGMPTPEDEELDNVAKRVLSNREEAQRIYQMIYDQKVIDFVKENSKVEEKELSYEDFLKIAYQA
jgi:trigger factor